MCFFFYFIASKQRLRFGLHSIAWHQYFSSLKLKKFFNHATPKVTYANRSIYVFNYLFSLVITLRSSSYCVCFFWYTACCCRCWKRETVFLCSIQFQILFRYILRRHIFLWRSKIKFLFPSISLPFFYSFITVVILYFCHF